MVYASDSKSDPGNGVRVRVPPRALVNEQLVFEAQACGQTVAIFSKMWPFVAISSTLDDARRWLNAAF